jgi:hypothetical protein
LPKELVMAVRFFALLIPLAITLPQLQASRPPAAAAAMPEPTAVMEPAAAPEWSYDTRRGADAALTRVVLDAPAREAMRTLDGPTPIATLPAAPFPGLCKARTPHAVSKPARPALLAKSSATAAALPRPPSRPAKTLALQAGCEPLTHCAPVEEAKVTPVSRRAL